MTRILYGNDIKQPTASVFNVVLFLIVLLALILRVYKIGADELWFDETISATAAMGSAKDIISGTLSPKSPPLYYLIIHIWGVVFGFGEVSLRSFSALAGTLLVAGVGFSGARFFSRRAGLAAAAISAVAPLGIYYSQEARSYILLALAGLAYFYFSMILADDDKPGIGIGYVVSGVALAHTHAAGLFLLPFPNIAMLARQARGRYFTLLKLELPIALCAMPYWVWLARKVPLELAGWVARTWSDMKPGEAFFRTFEALGAGADYPALIFRLSRAHEPVPAYASVILFAFLLVLGISRRRNTAVSVSTGNAPKRAAIALALPLVSAYLISTIWQPVYLVGRTDFLVAPVFYLLIGAGAARLKPLLFSCAAAALILFSFNDLFMYYSRLPMSSYKNTASYISGNSLKSNPVVCTGMTCIPMRYYMSRAGAPVNMISYPSGETMIRNGYDPERLLEDTSVLARQAKEAGAALARASEGSDRALIIADMKRFHKVNEYLFRELKGNYAIETVGNRENGILVCTIKKSLPAASE